MILKYLALNVSILSGLCGVLGIAALPSLWRKRKDITMGKMKEQAEQEKITIAWEEAGPFDFTLKDFVGTLLADAKAWLTVRWRAGDASTCPCCGQTVAQYRRSISGSMARALMHTAKHGRANSQEILKGTSIGGGGDHGKLVLWGLLEQSKRGGDWRCTEKGRDFLLGRIRVPKYLYVYNRTVYGQSQETCSISDCIGKVFDLDEITYVPEPIINVDKLTGNAIATSVPS